MIILNNLSRCLSARVACLKNKLLVNMLKNIDNTLRVSYKTLFLVLCIFDNNESLICNVKIKN